MNVFCIADGALTIIGTFTKAELIVFCETCQSPALYTLDGRFLCASCAEGELDYQENESCS